MHTVREHERHLRALDDHVDEQDALLAQRGEHVPHLLEHHVRAAGAGSDPEVARHAGEPDHPDGFEEHRPVFPFAGKPLAQLEHEVTDLVGRPVVVGPPGSVDDQFVVVDLVVERSSGGPLVDEEPHVGPAKDPLV